jgi:hypothetical protein
MKSHLYLILVFILFPLLSFSQDNQDSTANETSTFSKFKNNFSGSIESNAQWYLNDKKTGDFDSVEPVRANSYLKLNYFFLENFSAGVQVESYAPKPLLNYDSEFDEKIGLAQYYVNYRTQKLDVTAGYFYSQFGSGLLLRTWEDTALGLNNSIRGGNVKYNPFDFLEVTGLYGSQRRGFDVSDSNIMAFNVDLNINNLMHSNVFDQLSFGFGFVNRNEEFESISTDPNKIEVPDNVTAYSGRIDFAFKNIYTNLEYVYKSEDVRLNNTIANQVSYAENQLFDGSAILFNIGYSTKGFGIDYTFRRLENMSFYSQREDMNLINNPTNRATLNYLPALTKQHDYSLANIYLYQAQPGLYVKTLYESPFVKAGEIGNQIDVFYKFKKGSFLGGKYGTKITANLSYWAALNVDVTDPDFFIFPSDNLTYESDFLNFKNKLFSEFNTEISKKWSKKFSSIFTYINLFYNYDYLVEANGTTVKAWIGVAESTYRFGKGQSIRLEGQHLSSNDRSRNWVGGTLEYFMNSNFGVYFNDSYNYEESPIEEDSKIHFFNIGGSYTKGATRVALNYGRQRGGLLCVGGICREVQPNTGVTINFTTSF